MRYRSRDEAYFRLVISFWNEKKPKPCMTKRQAKEILDILLVVFERNKMKTTVIVNGIKIWFGNRRVSISREHSDNSVYYLFDENSEKELIEKLRIWNNIKYTELMVGLQELMIESI